MIRAMHIVPGPGSGGDKLIAADMTLTLDRERFEAGALGLLDNLCSKDPEETLAQRDVFVWHLGKRWGSVPQTRVRLARVPDRVPSHAGSALSSYIRRLAQCAPSLDNHEEPR